MTHSQPRSGDMPYVPPADAPQWFLDNIRRPGVSHCATLEGRRVHFLAWNLEDESLPVLLLVHGFGGHAHWWSYLAPFFADRYRVIAIDLPGMGESEAPSVYDHTCFARGILAVIRQFRIDPVTIAAHSFGGIQAMYAMTLEPNLFVRGIVIDSNIRFPQQRPSGIDLPPLREHKRHPSREACMSRFSLTPPQPEALDFLMDYVAYHSCTSDREGWHWKFDYRVRTANLITDADLLTHIPVRVDCIYGEHSIYNRDDLPRLARQVFPNFGRLIVVPDAYHHLPMDHPLELVAAIDELLAERPGRE